MLRFNFLPGPFLWDGDTRRRRENVGTGSWPPSCCVQWTLEKSYLFPPQGDVFVAVDMLNSAGIEVVAEPRT